MSYLTVTVSRNDGFSSLSGSSVDLDFWVTERSMVRAMCGVQLNDRQLSTDLMLKLGLNETTDQFPVANNVR